MTRRLTITIVLIAVVALIIYDVIIVVEPTPNDSVSEVVSDWAERYATVPLAAGIVAGHLFWPPRDKLLALGPWLLLVWGTVFAALDLFGVLPRLPVMPVLLGGFVLGAWLWGRRED